MNLLENLGTNNSIILVLAVLIGVYILVKVSAKIIKTVLLIAVGGLVFYFWQGGTVGELKEKALNRLFGKGSLAALSSSYCQGEKADKLKCQCIIEPLDQQLKSTYNEGQLHQLDADPATRADALGKALKSRKAEISKCLAEKGGKQGKEYLTVLEMLWGQAKEQLSETEEGKPS